MVTVYEHLMARKADIADKEARNGLTSGLIVQKRQVLKELERLSLEDGQKEYVPETQKQYGDFHGY
jgi:hypothetical protein